jgi:o-succinylbenzoate synthase
MMPRSRGSSCPANTSGSSRHCEPDVTPPFVLDGGYLLVPAGPGIGTEPIAEILDSVTTSKQWLPNSGG